MEKNYDYIFTDAKDSGGDLKSCNQVFIVDGKCDFSKPSIFEQLAKINKLKYRKIKKYNKFKNKSGAIK